MVLREKNPYPTAILNITNPKYIWKQDFNPNEYCKYMKKLAITQAVKHDRVEDLDKVIF